MMGRRLPEFEREVADPRDPERRLTVFFSVESWGTEPSGCFGPPEHYDPGSGAEIVVDRFEDEDGRTVELTDEDRWKVEEIILGNMPEAPEPSYEEDWP